MDKVQLMELVRSYQVGKVDRRAFLVKSAAALGSVAAANTLLAACAGPLSGTVTTNYEFVTIDMLI